MQTSFPSNDAKCTDITVGESQGPVFNVSTGQGNFYGGK